MAPMTASFAAKLRPSTRLDAGGAAVGDLDARHVGIGEHLAAVVLDAGDQRIGELAGAAARHAEAVGLEEAEEHVGADGGGLLVGRHQVLAGDAREVHAHLLVLEQLAQVIVAAHLHDAPELAAFAALVHHGVGGADRRRRRIQRWRRSSAATPRPAATPCRKVSASCFENFAISAAERLAVAVQLERRAVLEHRHHRHFGEDVFEAVARLELELVVLQQRIALDEDVAHRMLVVPEARQGQFARDHAAAEPGIALEHQHLLAGRGQIGGGHEAVVAGADGDDVCCIVSLVWPASGCPDVARRADSEHTAMEPVYEICAVRYAHLERTARHNFIGGDDARRPHAAGLLRLGHPGRGRSCLCWTPASMRPSARRAAGSWCSPVAAGLRPWASIRRTSPT